MRTRSTKLTFDQYLQEQRQLASSATLCSPPSPKKQRRNPPTPLLTPQHPKPLATAVLKTPRKVVPADKGACIRRTLQYSAQDAGAYATSVLQRVVAGQLSEAPIVGRSEEHQRVRDVLLGEGSLFIIGPPGTGKSSSVNELLAETGFEMVQPTTKRKRGKSGVAVKVNCSTFTDPAALYAAVAEQVRRATSWKVPETFDPYMLDAFVVTHREVKTRGKRNPLVVVLDEVDQLLRLPARAQPVVKEVLRFFVRWAEIAPGDVKFLGIMNGVDMYEQVSRVHVGDDASQVPRVLFGSYSHENLLLILQSFMERALPSNLTAEAVATFIEPRAMELIARKVAARDGDARRAISLLQQSSRHALQRTDSAASVKITIRDVAQSASAMLSSPIVQQIKQLPRQAKVLLYVITSLSPSAESEGSSSPSSPKRAARCDMNQVSDELARLRGLPQTAWVPRLSREDLQTHLMSLDCYALVKRGSGKRSEKTARAAAAASGRAFWTSKLASCVSMAEMARALQDDTPLCQLLAVKN